MRVKDEILDGIFWDPEEKLDSHPCRLTIFDGGKIEIQASCGFLKNIDTVPVVLHGQLLDGQLITLMNPYGFYFDMYKGTKILKFYSIYFGCHILTIPNMSEVKFEIENFQNFVPENLFFSEDGKEINDVSIDITEDLKLILISGLKENPYERYTSLSYKENIILIFKSINMNSLNYYINYIFQLNNFLRFISNQVSSLCYIKFYHKNKEIKYVFQSVPFSLEQSYVKYTQTMYNYFVPQCYNSNVYFIEILSKWFIVYEKFSAQILLYIDAVSELYYKANEIIFLRLAQSVESYHRNKNSDDPILKLEKQDYKKFKRDLAKFAKKHVVKHKFEENNTQTISEFIHNSLAHCNEEYFSQRIENMICEFYQIIDFLPSKITHEPLIIANDIKNSRNYYTHYSPELKECSKKGAELAELSYVLKYILQSQLLKSIGYKDYSIKEIIQLDCQYWVLRENLFK